MEQHFPTLAGLVFIILGIGLYLFNRYRIRVSIEAYNEASKTKLKLVSYDREGRGLQYMRVQGIIEGKEIDQHLGSAYNFQPHEVGKELLVQYEADGDGGYRIDTIRKPNGINRYLLVVAAVVFVFMGLLLVNAGINGY